jgi:hypothetical protein
MSAMKFQLTATNNSSSVEKQRAIRFSALRRNPTTYPKGQLSQRIGLV